MARIRFWTDDLWRAHVAACQIERLHAKPSPPATEKQRALLLKLRAPAFVGAQLTKAEASQVIGWMIDDQRQYVERRRAEQTAAVRG